MATVNPARITEHVAAAVAERAQQKNISRWQKARELLGLQDYLKSVGEPHSTRDIARLTKIAPTTVVEHLQVATALTPEVLASAGVSEEQLSAVRHRTLLRIAKLPPYLRANPLRAAARGEDPLVSETRLDRMPAKRDARRADTYAALCEGREVPVSLPRPISELSAAEINDCLDVMLPTLARLAEIVIPPQRSHYVAHTGNGGILVYLCPSAK